MGLEPGQPQILQRGFIEMLKAGYGFVAQLWASSNATHSSHQAGLVQELRFKSAAAAAAWKPILRVAMM